MKSDDVSIAEVFSQGGKVHYVLPIFQREYAWEKGQWQALLDDAFALLDELEDKQLSEVEHFLGSLVVIEAGTINVTVPQFQVVDGQQRLTTISLLLCALERSLAQDEEDQQALAEDIRSYLVNKGAKAEARFKLLPTTKYGDQTAYAAILEGKPAPSESRVSQAYAFFLKELAKWPSFEERQQLFLVVTQAFRLVLIRLNRNENPYRIFESLNGKGKPLSQADLVRNYIAMRLSPQSQEAIFHNEWRVIEEKLKEQATVGKSGLGELTAFLRHYMAMDSGALCSEEHVYARFRDRAKAKFPDEVSFATEIARLRRFAELYDLLLRPQGVFEEPLRRLGKLEASTAYPFLLRVLDASASGELNPAQVTSTLATLENYLVHRYLAGEATNYLNKLFPSLWKQVSEHTQTDSDFVAALKQVLAEKNYPSAAKIRGELYTRKFYDNSSLTKNRTALVLETINRHLSKGSGGYTVLEDTATIEHILPQTPDADWLDDLGPEAEQIQKDYLHTLGNLTLVTQSWNSALSNKSFTIKRQKLAEHALRINADYFRTLPALWDVAAIRARADFLLERILEIWPSLSGQERDVAATPPPLSAVSESQAAYHSDCVRRMEESLGITFTKITTKTFVSTDGQIRLVCSVSKTYNHKSESYEEFWYRFRPEQRKFLEEANAGFAIFGCGSAAKLIAFPASEFLSKLDQMNQTVQGDTFYWHVLLREEEGKFFLVLKRGTAVDVSVALLPGGK